MVSREAKLSSDKRPVKLVHHANKGTTLSPPIGSNVDKGYIFVNNIASPRGRER